MKPAQKLVRCAIYTRKSSEEGLEQDFNSLHAQAEACAAYILSQASEGWSLIPAEYDDGGLSGGTLERPALQRLLADIAAGRIDIVVVYKVDRLTRSLIDFAKLVEALDAAGTSFVSVTQAFNTTTSMGRLTLNMLLSFAQFEREVTAERIRDKIAASKAKGMWMGGTVPLGYRAHGRTLAIVGKHAAVVRDIYARYLKLRNVRLVAEALIGEGITIPVRKTGTGRTIGGGVFSRGQINAILTNPIYAGDIAHRGQVHAGQHPAIIERADWEAVQHQLAANRQGQRQSAGARTMSPLAGRIVDGAGEPLLAVHATGQAKGRSKPRKRYRYYVSKALHFGTRASVTDGLRLPAGEVEAVVAGAIADRLDDPLGLAGQTGLTIAPCELKPFVAGCKAMAGKLRAGKLENIATAISQVRVQDRHLAIDLSMPALREMLGLEHHGNASALLTIEHIVRLTRTGRAMRLIDGTGATASGGDVDAVLIRLVLRARSWWQVLAQGQLTLTELAAREEVTNSYMVRVVRLAFLSPKVLDALLEGTLRAGIDAAALTAPGAIDPVWAKQEARLLAR